MSTPDVTYIKEFYTLEKSEDIFLQLRDFAFKSPDLVIHGRKYNPLRKSCSFGDEDVSYAYSGFTDTPKPWPQLLLDLKADVELNTGFSYNYCLLNLYENGLAKIGFHKDDESSLEPLVPIPTLSFGATRNIVFSKKSEKPVIISLETGSLLIMKNQEWFHSIPPQHEVQEARISVTFRKITPFTITTLKSVKRELDQWDKSYAIQSNRTTKRTRLQNQDVNIPPSPTSISSDEQFLEIVENPISPIPLTQDHASTSTDLQIPERDWLTHLVEDETKELKKINLGDDLFATIQIYQGEVCVHIRKYFHNDQGDLCPSKVGVRLDMITFYKFYMKIFEMLLTDSDESTVFNNVLLALVEDRRLRLVKFTSLGLFTRSVWLTQSQLSMLKNNISVMVNTILKYLFEERLPRTVCAAVPYNAETMDLPFTQLKLLVESNLLHHINKNYKCEGCKFENMSQSRHDCINRTAREKLNSVDKAIRILCDVNTIAKDFLMNNSKLSKEMNFKALYTSLYTL